MVDEEQHILRYWEKEFPHLKPRKNRGGNRIYSEKDIELIQMIRNLLRVDKLSLKGAKEAILKVLTEETNGSLFPDLEQISTNNISFLPENDLVETKSKKKATITFTNTEAGELLKILKQFSLALGNEH